MQTKTFSRIYRIIHWAMAISFFLLLATIIMRLHWLNKHHVADIILPFLESKDLELSRKDAIVLAKQIRNPLWNWHMVIGYVLIGVIALRFIFALPGTGKLNMKFKSPLKSGLSLKEKTQRWIYITFYVLTVISLITGVMVEWIPKGDELRQTAKVIHKLSIYYLVAYIIIHLANVLYSELTSEKGLISGVISGYKTKE